jgi:hypothetical protein
MFFAGVPPHCGQSAARAAAVAAQATNAKLATNARKTGGGQTHPGVLT